MPASPMAIAARTLSIYRLVDLGSVTGCTICNSRASAIGGFELFAIISMALTLSLGRSPLPTGRARLPGSDTLRREGRSGTSRRWPPSLHRRRPHQCRVPARSALSMRRRSGLSVTAIATFIERRHHRRRRASISAGVLLRPDRPQADHLIATFGSLLAGLFLAFIAGATSG